MAESNMPQRNAPSIMVITSREDVAKSTLKTYMLGVSEILAFNDEKQIRNFISVLKDHHKSYSNASRTLSRWFLKNAALQRSSEIRNERLLLHDDVEECIETLNVKLENLGHDMESILGELSTIASLKQPIASLADSDECLLNNNDTIKNVETCSVGDEMGLVNFENNTRKLDQLCLNDVVQPDIDIVKLSDQLPSVKQKISEEQKCPSLTGIPNFIHQSKFGHDRKEGMDVPSRATNEPYLMPPHFVPFSNNHVNGVPDYSDPISREPIAQPHMLHENSSAPNPVHNMPYVNETSLDSTARQFLKMEIMKGFRDPFDGTSRKFWAWYGYINARMLEASMGPLDIIHALKANTKGKPNQIISNYIDTGIINPGHVLEEIWSTFKRRYGSNDQVSANLRDEMMKSPKIRSEDEIDSMEELYGLCKLICANAEKCPSLRYYFLPEGMREIWEKMPNSFVKKWQGIYCDRQERGQMATFNDLLSQMLKFITRHSNPMFNKVAPPRKTRVLVTDAKFDRSTKEGKLFKSYSTKDENNTKDKRFNKSYSNKDENNTKTKRFNKSYPAKNEYKVHCYYHKVDTHSTYSCQTFGRLPYNIKKDLAAEHGLCFKCLRRHRANQCRSNEKCSICKGSHITMMHQRNHSSHEYSDSVEANPETSSQQPVSLCTSVCKGGIQSKICSKTLPVELRIAGQQSSLKCLVILDEQSNSTFVDERIIDLLQVPPSHVKDNTYTLSTLEQLKSKVEGKLVSGLEVKGLKKSDWIKLPPSLTHPGLPDTRAETSDSSVVQQHPHIKHFAKHFPKIDSDLEVMLLVGTNCGNAMRTRCYGDTFPFVHDTALGFAMVGPSCLDSAEDFSMPRVMRTAVQNCEHFSTSRPIISSKPLEPHGPSNVFIEHPDDELPGLSKDNDEFLRIVAAGIHKNYRKNIVVPIPFKKGAFMPDNKFAVFKRSGNTLSRIKRNPDKTAKCVEIMQKYLDDGHVEELPKEDKGPSYRNYIPTFVVENENKGKLRVVFDSSAKYRGISLNDCILQGPDETNRLIGVLIRFRHEVVAVSADIECMFHSFYVPNAQRDYQCFFWWSKNDPNNDLAVYRANVHVFGHTSSPSVATYGLRYTTRTPEAESYPDACEFIMDNFYVDDGLRSEKTESQAISTLTDTRKILSSYNIRLHKIVSTHASVLQAFPPSEIAANVDAVDLQLSSSQRALGISWKLDSDEFQLKCCIKQTEFTKRTVLSVNGSLFDPLGIASPVGLTGKLLQRKIFLSSKNSEQNKRDDWDDPLPNENRNEWKKWIDTLEDVNCVKLPRCYHPAGFGEVMVNELHIFCDAAKDSIGHVIYLRQVDQAQNIAVSFVFASSKVAPKAAASIPRLELCAAVGAAQSAQYVKSELKTDVHLMQYYSDSNIVLGYLNNRIRCFSRYVTSRVQNILSVSSPEQWKYVSTKNNPADIATRAHTPKQLVNTSWLTGPDFLKVLNPEVEEYEEVNIELPETAKESHVLQCTKIERNDIISHLEKFSNWKKMCNVTTNIFIFSTKLRRQDVTNEVSRRSAIFFIIREIQKIGFGEVYSILAAKNELPRTNELASLNPFLDEDGLLRVGGRLRHGDLPYEEKHPVLLPRNHPITLVILRHYHELSNHQGRHVTVSSLRRAGIHIHKPRNLISTFLKSCVTCKKLRGSFQTQQMADLPPDRLHQTAPFEKVGMDVFGPYVIHDGRSTRRTTATKKIWVLLFTCLFSRAVHLECLSSLDTPTFMMAFRRFVAIRGKCSLIRSDHGTNFMGAKNLVENGVDVSQLKDGIEGAGCVWELVPPYASHFAGVWERKVGSVKRILNAAIFQAKNTSLSRDEFATLLQEAGSIVNHTPLGEVACDPNEPLPVSPATLLTLREGADISRQDTYTEEDLLSYGKKRYRRVQYLADQFWVRWKRDYLSSLQERNKWKFPSRNMVEKDVVLVRENSHRNEWPLAVVERVLPSSDGMVRKVFLRLKPTESGVVRIVERSVHDLVLLVPAS